MASDVEVCVAELRGTLRALGKCVDRGRGMATCDSSRKVCNVADVLINEAMDRVDAISQAYEFPPLPPPMPLRPSMAQSVRGSVLQGDWNIGNYF